MKWFSPRYGQKKYKKGFLFFPKTLHASQQSNRKVTRWLEYAEWVLLYKYMWFASHWSDLKAEDAPERKMLKGKVNE